MAPRIHMRLPKWNARHASRRCARTLCGLTAALIIPWTLAAQADSPSPASSARSDSTPPIVVAPATTPFRAGQWGGEIALFSGLGSLGLLRFTTPTNAWLVDGAFGGGVASTSSSDSRTRTGGNLYARVRGGPRRYRRLGDAAQTPAEPARALGFAGFGAIVSASWSGSSAPGSPRFHAAGLGAFVEAGGTAMVTTYLGLGLVVEASVLGEYRSLSIEGDDGPETVSIERRLNGSAGTTRFFAAVFF